MWKEVVRANLRYPKICVEGNAENLNENSHSPAQVEIAIFLI